MAHLKAPAGARRSTPVRGPTARHHDEAGARRSSPARRLTHRATPRRRGGSARLRAARVIGAAAGECRRPVCLARECRLPVPVLSARECRRQARSARNAADRFWLSSSPLKARGPLGWALTRCADSRCASGVRTGTRWAPMGPGETQREAKDSRRGEAKEHTARPKSVGPRCLSKSYLSMRVESTEGGGQPTGRVGLLVEIG
jgi:hypothetical protein